jgi:hypothetical protein
MKKNMDMVIFTNLLVWYVKRGCKLLRRIHPVARTVRE